VSKDNIPMAKLITKILNHITLCIKSTDAGNMPKLGARKNAM
jgi:hypothetical protein